MEPTRDRHATLVDLLDRVLDKGLILDADIIIHLAGIPLLGVKLKAALAGMETMLRYGIWEDWDKAQRALATEEHRREWQYLLPGEKILLEMFASEWYGKGLYHSWRPGNLYITDRRVFLFRKKPAEILFQTSYEAIKGMDVRRECNDVGREIDCIYFSLDSEEPVLIHPIDASLVRDSIEERMKAMGLEIGGNSPCLSACQDTEATLCVRR